MRWAGDALDFAETVGLLVEDVESVVKDRRSSQEVDPRTAEVGYPVRRFRRGDVTVVVGYRDSEPTILFVHVHGRSHKHLAVRRADGRANASRAPKTWMQLRSRVVASGLRIEVRSRHESVLDEESRIVGSITERAGDPRALQNAWKQIERQSGREI